MIYNAHDYSDQLRSRSMSLSGQTHIPFKYIFGDSGQSGLTLQLLQVNTFVAWNMIDQNSPTNQWKCFIQLGAVNQQRYFPSWKFGSGQRAKMNLQSKTQTPRSYRANLWCDADQAHCALQACALLNWIYFRFRCGTGKLKWHRFLTTFCYI